MKLTAALRPQKSANDYCQGKLLPRIVEANRSASFDKAIMKEMGAMGFLGPTIQGYGCAGVGYVSYGLIANAVEQVRDWRSLGGLTKR